MSSDDIPRTTVDVGKDEQLENQQEFREKVHDAFGWNCYLCNFPVSNSPEGVKSTRLHTHHINGDDDDHRVANGIPVCNNCNLRITTSPHKRQRYRIWHLALEDEYRNQHHQQEPVTDPQITRKEAERRMRETKLWDNRFKKIPDDVEALLDGDVNQAEDPVSLDDCELDDYSLTSLPSVGNPVAPGSLRVYYYGWAWPGSGGRAKLVIHLDDDLAGRVSPLTTATLRPWGVHVVESRELGTIKPFVEPLEELEGTICRYGDDTE